MKEESRHEQIDHRAAAGEDQHPSPVTTRRALLRGAATAAWIVPVVWTLTAQQAQAAPSGPQCATDGELCSADADCCSNDCQGFACNGN